MTGGSLPVFPYAMEEIMHYPAHWILPALFVSRPNRFIAHCQLLADGNPEVVCHVKNTGRCKELLLPGTLVYLCKAETGSNRKTDYDLIAVQKGERLINIDSQAPNVAAAAFLQERYEMVRPEVRYGDSRIDFMVESGNKRSFIEVKGVTLEREGAVYFPDAPTERGTKHLLELKRAVSEGYGAAVLFVVQMDEVRYFAPNVQTDPTFASALREAADAGVEVWAYSCRVTPEFMVIDRPVEVRL